MIVGVLMNAKFEFFTEREVTLDYLKKCLNNKRDYFDKNIVVIHIEDTGKLAQDNQKLYNVFCKGVYR